jgi:hypothetical protein
LVFPALATTWDEGLPLGNAMLGELLWANGPFVRFSLDRADLWDLRPMKNLDGPEWKYRWVVDQWKKGDYRPVQDRFDAPYDTEPAPSKIPTDARERPGFHPLERRQNPGDIRSCRRTGGMDPAEGSAARFQTRLAHAALRRPGSDRRRRSGHRPGPAPPRL